MPKLSFELCAESVEAARAAEIGGADRIELCSALSSGGLTPDPRLTAASIATVSIPVCVLVRPRGGDFVYSAAEFDIMKRQIEQARATGASGVALGVLLPGGRIDKGRTCTLVDLARPMTTTFHRAFDETPNLFQSLEDVIETGADALLTSGGAPDVLLGAGVIARLVRQSAGRIQIVAGGGLRLETLIELVRRTGTYCLHGSLTRSNGSCNAGSNPNTLAADVREAVRLLRSASQLGPA